MPKPAEPRETQKPQVLTPHRIFGKLSSLSLLTTSLRLQRCRPGVPNLISRDARLVSPLEMLDLLPRDAGGGDSWLPWPLPAHRGTASIPLPCWEQGARHRQPQDSAGGGRAPHTPRVPVSPRPVPVAQRFPRGLTLILAAWLRCSAKSRCTAGPSAAPQSRSRRQRSAIAARDPRPPPPPPAYTRGGGTWIQPGPAPPRARTLRPSACAHRVSSERGRDRPTAAVNSARVTTESEPRFQISPSWLVHASTFSVLSFCAGAQPGASFPV